VQMGWLAPITAAERSASDAIAEPLAGKRDMNLRPFEKRTMRSKLD